MKPLVVGTRIWCTSHGVLDITKGKSYAIASSQDREFSIVDDANERSEFLYPFFHDYFSTEKPMPKKDTPFVPYATADFIPVTGDEANKVMAILAMMRGLPLNVEGKPMGRGTNICINKAYSRAYETVHVPWAFIADNVSQLELTEMGAIYAIFDSGDRERLPLKLDISGARLPQTIHRPKDEKDGE